MQFQITEIEFDFSDSFYEETVTEEYKREIYDEVIGSMWEADDGDDLIEEITSAYGWCIKSIDYRAILN